jgi:hypothetical protein
VRPSRRSFALAVVPALLALGACGSAIAPASRLLGTAPVPSEAAATPTAVRPTTTGAAGATSTAAPSATTANAGTTAPAPASSAPAPPASTAASAPQPTSGGAPPTTATGAVTRVTAMYTSIGYSISGAEAACLAGATDPSVLGAVEAGGDAAIVGKVAGGLVQALAKCEPESFLKEQDDITVDDYKVDATQARCVTKALDAAAVADAVIAQAYFEGTTTLPADKMQRLIDQLTPCVGAAKAREIVTT